MSLTPHTFVPDPILHFLNPNRRVPLSCHTLSLNVTPHVRRNFFLLNTFTSRNLSVHSSVSSSSGESPWLNLRRAVAEISASSVFLLVVGAFGVSSYFNGRAALASVGTTGGRPVLEEIIEEGKGGTEITEDEQLREAFETWKSKTYALTVPLGVVALQGSVPPAWIKDFLQLQGNRLRLSMQFRGSLEKIYSEVRGPFKKSDASAKSTLTADLMTVGDSWLNLAISEAIIEPIHNAEDHDWFRGLTEKWKVYLRRNNEGKIDPQGKVWAVPYRWGSMVIAYKKSKFEKLGLSPIEDWADLWRPELEGRISMIDSPREVIGAVLKYMGASYNTNDFSKDIPGGVTAVQNNLTLLSKQVLLFDNLNYLKAFAVNDAWVAVGWSSDILPAAKRMSDVAVIVPKSGASLWADLWAVPNTTKLPSADNVGGRIRGPSPLIHQWLDFCLQPARQLPFNQGVSPGASPSSLGGVQSEFPKDLPKGAPKLVTNLVAGIPPAEILTKCEFLEPLSEDALSDYRWLIANMPRSGRGSIQQILLDVYPAAWTKLRSLVRRDR